MKREIQQHSMSQDSNPGSCVHLQIYKLSVTRTPQYLSTHPDLPVQDVSSDIDSRHDLTANHTEGSGAEGPGVRGQMTFTLSSGNMLQ